ncbi:hypothetical protein BN938_1972 [Mucinivorans hirudinis]|uniref:Uncharacterized protein n=1 Tax=Mucinivorans hirudinis TaxID=1433126 RepID=A0A060RDR3_9BACT|nr:hypothetical protein BN938_1972 [Mucinivorans hirudinis]
MTFSKFETLSNNYCDIFLVPYLPSQREQWKTPATTVFACLFVLLAGYTE